MKKHIILKDGTIVHIEPVNGTEDAREFQRFINTLTREGTYLLVNKPVTLKQEKQWLKTQIKEQRKGQQIYLKALVDGRLIGDCFAKPGFGRNHGNVNLGIAIAKKMERKRYRLYPPYGVDLSFAEEMAPEKHLPPCRHIQYDSTTALRITWFSYHRPAPTMV